ncbi:MAG: CBS domain-containing protein [Gammaproteobacteria bacterium]|nr:CBS domain-containing protein [Gammaproteobacteria bacterium]
MSTVKQILDTKEQAIWSVAPEETIFSAIQLMADKRIGAVLVMENNHLTGIFSERDYAREVILKGRSSKETPVRAIMTREVITIPSSHRIDDSLSLMTVHRIRHLPIVDKDQVVGIISIGDLVKMVISEQHSTIEHLENYIKG